MAGRPNRPPTQSWLEKSALYYLERFNASAAQFRRVMLRKIDRKLPDGERASSEHKAWLDDLIVRFTAYGYLDDARYASQRAECLLSRGKPRQRIAADLRAKGVAADLVETVLETLEDSGGDSDLYAAVRYAKRRGFGAFARTANPKPVDKQLAAMARAGFGYDLSRTVLDAEDPEALLLDAC